jgi:SAM-dependent methyltransferase
VAESPEEALARYYDLDLGEDAPDVEMYLAFAQATAGPILELMAGSGRVAVPLAAAGHPVTAVDRDPRMLARAAARWQGVSDRAQGGTLDLVEADVTSLELDGSFELVIVPLNSILLLDDRAAQQALFATIAEHLAPNGRAVIDVWLPAPDDLVLYDGRLILDWIKDDPETGAHVSKETAAHYHSASRTSSVTSIFDEWHDRTPPTRTMREDAIMFISSDELQSFARTAGLSVDTLAGDYEMGHFAGDSERVVMVCRPASR